LFSLKLNNRGIWLLVLLAPFGLASVFASQTLVKDELSQCALPALEGGHVNCEGIGKKANNLFLLFGNKININDASAADLKLIPKMRKNVAKAIVERRETLGRFLSYDQVSEIKGVGPKTLETIKLHTFID
jgi:competence ComEA-like helix-hairpin-helix protein